MVAVLVLCNHWNSVKKEKLTNNDLYIVFVVDAVVVVPIIVVFVVISLSFS